MMAAIRGGEISEVSEHYNGSYQRLAASVVAQNDGIIHRPPSSLHTEGGGGGDDGDERLLQQSSSSSSRYDGRRLLTLRGLLKIVGAALSVSLYLFTWVANGEFVQGVSTGQFGAPAFDKPTFIAWFSYNFLFLGSCIPIGVCLYVQNVSLGAYLLKWVGTSSVPKMIGAACLMTYLLIILNILWIVGLGHISVATSNAVYQLQAVATLALSVWILNRPFHWFSLQTVGIIICMVGVGLIVLPPLLVASSSSGEGTSSSNNEEDEQAKEQDATNNTTSRKPLFGIVMTLVSSILWAIYQIAWDLLSQSKHEASSDAGTTAAATTTTRLEGLMDTLFTVAVMGLCNLFVGWPVVLWMHWMGWEVFEWPNAAQWILLFWNGWIEFSFDASCAIAIYTTSPVMTAMTAPLTIPISFLWEMWLWWPSSSSGDGDDGGGLLGWLGAVLVLIGIVLLERQPKQQS